MMGLLARLIGGAISPLVERSVAIGASLLRKLALFAVAALSLVVVLIALTIAFDLWISQLAGPIVGALAVAGLYLVFALVALFLALRGPAKATAATSGEEAAPSEQARANDRVERGAAIDRFTAPVLSMLSSLGLVRERLAVVAGASIAKQLGPLPLVTGAVIAGFLIGRMYKGWRSFLSFDALTAAIAAFTMAPDPLDDETAA